MTETWEKFSYYGMRAILVYYMIKELHFTPAKASVIYGLYTGLAYFTPIFGGAIADRWMGPRRAVIIGGLIMATGHFMLTFEPLFYPALAAVALGNGLYLPSLPSQITSLYRDDDPRRSGAYNIYYVGINLGAVLAPLACGFLGEAYGWHYGFAAAGVGMCVGLLVFVLGSPLLPQDASQVSSRTLLGPVSAGRGFNKQTASLLLGVGLAVVIFRGAYEQMGNTVAIWIDSDVDRKVANFVIPASWFQSLNPLLVFVLTPILVWAWARAARRGYVMSPITRMTVGAIGIAFAFAVLAAIIFLFNGSIARPGWLWPMLFVLLYTAGELYILPTGLGLFARLAPERRGATTIAAWFLASFGGNLLAGGVGALWGRADPAVFFGGVAGLSLVSAAWLALLRRQARALDVTG